MRRGSLALAAGCLLWSLVEVGRVSPAGAQVTAVSGGAFGHYTRVSLFGGPSIPVGPVPDVRLPSGGSAQPLTANEAAGSAVYGPAHIFGGVWPADVDVAPPSGPTTVSTRGTTGAGASVTSSVDITLRSPPDPKSPGGWGPLPPTQGDELHATCTANESGVSGSTRLVNAVMSKATTPVGEPIDEERIPDNPPPNYTREGVLTNVGDRYRIVYNEQFVDAANRTITVNAVHMYLLGDIAVGEQIVGQVRCSLRPDAFPTTPAAPPTTVPPPTTAPATTTPPATNAPSTPGPSLAAQSSPDPDADSGSGSSAVPLIAAGAVVLAGGAAAAGVRRRRNKGSLAHDP